MRQNKKCVSHHSPNDIYEKSWVNGFLYGFN